MLRVFVIYHTPGGIVDKNMVVEKRIRELAEGLAIFAERTLQLRESFSSLENEYDTQTEAIRAAEAMNTLEEARLLLVDTLEAAVRATKIMTGAYIEYTQARNGPLDNELRDLLDSLNFD